MPGLLRGMARTAVVAGTAAGVAGRVQRRQQQRWATEDAEQAPASETAGSSDDQLQQLEKLGELKDKGILTEAEFEAKKKQLLG
jgi:Short C-terminal domain